MAVDPRWTRWLLILALAAPAAVAHDMWVVPPGVGPSGVRPAGVPLTVGELAEIRLRVGHGGHSEPVTRDPRRLVRLVAVGPGGELPVPGLDGADPAGLFRPPAAGTWVVAYESTAAYSELPAARFERYLSEEGLENVTAKRRQRGQSAEPGRELYSRSLKSLFYVGGASPAAAAAPAAGDRPVGLPLELVLLSDPARLAAEPAELRLLLHGEALGGALVDVRRLDQGSANPRRTDSDGRVRFELGPGAWLVGTVHMEEAAASAGADWRTLFATLTFVVPEAPEVGR